MKAAPAPSFSYDMLSSEKLATELKETAARIGKNIRVTTATIIATGRDLSTIKPKLEYGTFTQWVIVECGLTMRTAQNYMRAGEFADGTCEMVALLSPATLYRLMAKSTPPEIVDKAMDLLQAGRPPTENEVKIWLDEAHIPQRPRSKHSGSRPKARSGRIPTQNDFAVTLAREVDGFFEGPDTRMDKFEALIAVRGEIRPGERRSLILALRRMAELAVTVADDLQADGEVIERAEDPADGPPRLPRPLPLPKPSSAEVDAATGAGALGNTNPSPPRPTEPPAEPIDYALNSPGPKHGMPDFLRTENRGKPPSQWVKADSGEIRPAA
jgi:hypothetical protein